MSNYCYDGIVFSYLALASTDQHVMTDETSFNFHSYTVTYVCVYKIIIITM